MAANFKAADRFPDRHFVPLGIAVIAVSDTRSLETDTAGALLVSLLEADGHRAPAVPVRRVHLAQRGGHHFHVRIARRHLADHAEKH